MSSSVRLEGRVLNRSRGLELPPQTKGKKKAGHSTTHQHLANIQFPSACSLAPGAYLLEANDASAGDPHLHRLILRALTSVALFL